MVNMDVCRALRHTAMAISLVCGLVARAEDRQATEAWGAAYTGTDVTGDHVLALWTFDSGAAELTAGGGRELALKLEGADIVDDGRFGKGLQCFRGYPVEDKPHRAVCAHQAYLSPTGPFTIEMWIKPAPELNADYPSAFLIDKKYVSHVDYQVTLGGPARNGTRVLHANLGFGADSASFASDSAAFAPGRWTHIAFTYDAKGNGRFYRDGKSLGGTSHPGREATAPGQRGLTIGDRNGSLYHGFPGIIDQVRICAGVLEFRPAVIALRSVRRVYRRMEKGIVLRFAVTNRRRTPLQDAACRFALAGRATAPAALGVLEPGAEGLVEFPLDTTLRPDAYQLSARVDIGGDLPYSATERFEITLVKRPRPRRMPVVMWGIGGTDNVIEQLDTLAQIGFTHCLCGGADFKMIWDAKQPGPAAKPETVAAARAMMDRALAADIHVLMGLSPGRWADGITEYGRVDRNGGLEKHVNGLHPEVQQFCYNVGASVAQTYGEYPALDGAMIHTEVRGHSSPSFAALDREAYRQFNGGEIPAQVAGRNGVRYDALEEFPADRIIPDEHPLLVYYRWYWKQGDGWNALHSALHRGLKTTANPRFWTFHDPAVRVASTWSNGGEVDVLSQWTYSYPDPIRIGTATDELFAMAAGAEHDQRVMKMTQVIWYRRQTAPMPGEQAQVADAFFDDHDHGSGTEADAPEPQRYRARWEREIPDAAFITIAPMHLREAFWAKLARPIRGIMYHGWQSLVPTPDVKGYRYTNPATQDELRRLVQCVVEPLGPALLDVPDRPSDIAFLESFTSQVFARRGTYGWNGGWAGDAYLILQYAQLQPCVIYEETLLRDGLDRYRVLVLTDCDVLTESVVSAVEAFQHRGGLVVADERLVPRLNPDILLPSHDRPTEADKAKALLLEKAAALRRELDPHYRRYAQSTTPDVLTRCRTAGSADYLFVLNDRREYGTYVGHHGLVMENGLPAEADVRVARQGTVYDLVRHQRIAELRNAGINTFHVALGPCEGRLFMITARAIATLQLDVPEQATRGDALTVNVGVQDAAGVSIDAVVPVQVRVTDPEGRVAEFSGHYGARHGALQVLCDLAHNDTAGVWTVTSRELASGRDAVRYVRVH